MEGKDGRMMLVVDGRTDNREELQRAIKRAGADLVNPSDAELILWGYQLWGEQCLGRIHGDFAMVIWDRLRNRVFCARDRIGVKPLYYHSSGDTLSIASEPAALLSLPWVTQELNDGVLVEYVADEFFSVDETLWKGIKRLPPAHYMEVDSAGIRPRRYWRPDLDETLICESDQDYADRYRALLSSCVSRCARSHRPVGFEVSGGLDSSAVFSMGEHLRRSGHLEAPRIYGYAMDFGDDPDAYELDYSRAVAEHLGVKIREIPAAQVPLAWFWSWAARFRDFPGYPNGFMSMGLRQAAHDRGCRVLLGGSGGDEWAGGVNRRLYYGEELQSGRWSHLLTCATADFLDYGAIKTAAWMVRDGLLVSMPAAVEALRAGKQWLSSGCKGRSKQFFWLNCASRDLIHKRRRGDRKSRREPNARRLRQVEQLDTLDHPFIVMALELEERMAASIGLELRHPMRDPRLIQFAIATPERLRRRGRQDKWLHRLALHDMLPAAVMRRNDKADFSVVFRRHLGSLDKGTLLSHPLCGRPILDLNGVSALLNAYAKAEGQSGSAVAAKAQWILWNLVACKAFCDTMS